MRRPTSTFTTAGLAAVLESRTSPSYPLRPGQTGPPLPRSRLRQPGWINPFPPITRIRRCLAPPRLPFCRPTYNRRFTEFDAKFKPSSIAISKSGKIDAAGSEQYPGGR